jgi:prepilin-type N-terminal cleavage/methylation domain-containing protein
MNRRGFTLAEIMVCIAIVVTLAALSASATIRAKRSANITKSVQNLHQMQIAMALYQGDSNASASPDDPASAGYPDVMHVLLSRLNLPLEVWRSPCGQNPAWMDKPVVIQYEYFLSTMADKFPDANAKYGEAMVAFVDFNCAEHGEPLMSEFVPHLGLGVTAAGNLLRVNRTGDPWRQSWWHVKEDIE